MTGPREVEKREHWLIIEGATENVSQFTMPLKSIYSKNIYFTNWKGFLNIAERIKKQKYPYNKINILFAFSELHFWANFYIT